jgi:hypothetical protein
MGLTTPTAAHWAPAPGQRPSVTPTGGSGAAGDRSTGHRGRRRGSRGPPGRRPNRSASTGRATVGRLPTPDSPAPPRTALVQSRIATTGSRTWWMSWAVQCAKRLAYRCSQISIGQGRRRRGGAEQVGARVELGPYLMGDGPQPTPDPVAHHCAPGPTADGVGDPRRFGGVTSQPGYRDRASSHAAAALAQGLEGGPVTDGPDQAVRLWRPLRRRDDRMARPALVDMRCRKPCFLARFLTFG